MIKHKYIVVKVSSRKYIVGRCMVGHEKKYVPLAYAENKTYAILLMDALCDYESQHGNKT